MQGENKKIRVLFLLTALHKDGAVLSTLTTLKHLDRSRFSPSLFVLKPSRVASKGVSWNLLLNDIDVTYGLKRGETVRKKLFYLFKRLYKLTRQTDVIVGGLEMAPTFLAASMGKIAGRASVGFIRNSLPDVLQGLPKYYKSLTKFIYPYLSKAVAISNGIKAGAEKLIPGLKGRIATVYIPIDIEQIRKLGNADLPEVVNRPPYLLAVGRLMPQKGFDILLHAYALARRHGLEQQLVIVGEGPQRKILEALIKELKLDDHVLLAGFQENPYVWMKNASLFVSSSRYEGFCRVLAEAQAVGTAVVSTDCPDGPAEVLEGGASGILVQNENPQALAEGMLTLIKNPGLVDQLRTRGTERVKEFTHKASIANFEEILTSLIPAKKSVKKESTYK